MDGLYHMRIEPLGGGKVTNAGVMVMRGGTILGGDAFFYYVGSYAASEGNWTGEFITKQHTRSGDFKPAFGALDLPIALSGTHTGVAFDGKAAIAIPDAPAAYKVSMHRIADA